MAYIKYKRITEVFDLTNNSEFQNDIQNFFDKLVQDGWDIIHYSEQYSCVPSTTNPSAGVPTLKVIVVAGKISSQIKNVI